MIENGIGGGNTITGLYFENRISLKDVLGKIPDYTILENDVYFEDEKVATFYKKNGLYKNLLEPKGIDYSKILSKKLIPDDCLHVHGTNKLFIVEIKFQSVEGSVDEKLQTCDFKKKQYCKLLEPLGLDVEYVYVFNDWFKVDKYRDVLNYIHSVECHYYFNEIPLEFLGLPRS